MSKCWAPGCNHYNVREKCSFFRFPKDRKGRNRWNKLLRRIGEPRAHTRVCSCHFRDGKKENGPELFEHNAKKRFSFPSPERRTRKRNFRAPMIPETSLKKPQEPQEVSHDIQEEETSGLPFNIKEEISIDECVLEDDLPKLEIFENTSSDVDPLPYVEFRTSQETVSRCIPEETTVVSSDVAENREKENREDYVDYAMYIAARLNNCNQSENAIAIAKERIEFILCDLDKGVFENLIAAPFS